MHVASGLEGGLRISTNRKRRNPEVLIVIECPLPLARNGMLPEQPALEAQVIPGVAGHDDVVRTRQGGILWRVPMAVCT